MSELSEIINDIGGGYDEVREIFFPDASLELLEVSDTANGFTVVETIDMGWYLKYSEFRNAFRLSVAKTDEDFALTVKKVSHARVNGEVYTIRAADTIPPQGTKPFYQFICDREFRKSGFRSAY